MRINSSHLRKNASALGLHYLGDGPNGKDPAKKRFKEATLLEVVGKSTEVVFYSGSTESARWAVFASAMALTWGFTQVYYFDGGLRAWHQAGYPVETGQ